LIVTKTPVHWFEVVSEPGRTMPPAGAKVAKAWEQKGATYMYTSSLAYLSGRPKKFQNALSLYQLQRES